MYTITYNANGGIGVPAAQTKIHGTPLTLRSITPTREGYIFAGWNTESNGSGTNYNAGAIYDVDANLTLYAKWTTNTYTISYNTNGGSSAPASQSKTHGESITLSNATPTKTNCIFLGWATSASATVVEYASGAPYTDDGDATLYAVWAQKLTKPTATQTSYNYNNGWQISLSLNNFDSNTMNITENSKNNAGIYNAVISLKDEVRYRWMDGSTDPITIEWKIVRPLAGAVSVGDYVAYPVEYNNVAVTAVSESGVRDTRTSNLTGWRVISKNIDLNSNSSNGTVNLVSAGVPLSYNHATSSSAVSDLTDNFCATYINSGFAQNGFEDGYIFNNDFTVVNNYGIPLVRALTAADVTRITGATVANNSFLFGNGIPSQLFAVGSYYWLGTSDPDYSNRLYRVQPEGGVWAEINQHFGVRPVV